MTTIKKGRIQSIVHDSYHEISIAILKNMYVIVPLLITALVWVLGLLYLISRVFRSYQTWLEMGIAGMLFFWLILGGIIFSTLYWIFFGKERLIVTQDFIQTEKPIHLYKRKRAYPLREVSRIRITNELFKVYRNGNWTDDARTVLLFEVPYKEVAFGRGIKPEEADFILLELARTPYLDEAQFEPVSVT